MTNEEKIEFLENQLHKQEKLASLGMLSAGIAHEIQNPLNFVINFSKMSGKLLDDLTELIDDCSSRLDDEDADEMREISADLKENLEKIHEHGARAISIIRGILLQSRGKENEFLPTDISQLVHEYVWLSFHAMRANDRNFNVSIHEDYPEGMSQMMVIPQDLCRAVLNVMNNACYAVTERAKTESGDYVPTVSIKVCAREKDFTISISDNGTGMTPEVREKLFHTFFTTKPAGQGTGLGLTITHDIIKNKHKGEIEVETVPGEGTTFTFVIPNTLKK